MSPMISRSRLMPALVAMLLLGPVAPCEAEPTEAYAGRPVAKVIDEFRAAGYPFAYSTNLVSPDMLVESEPTATEAVDIVREILAPFHLTVREDQGFLLIVRSDAGTGSGSLLLMIRDDQNWRLIESANVSATPELPKATVLSSGVYQYPSLEARDYRLVIESEGFEPSVRNVRVRAGKPTVVEVELREQRREIEMITVSSSRYDIWSDLGSSPFVMTQLSIQNLPDIGDDPLRAAQVLPGMASTGVSAKTYFRGGEYRETSVYLNGNKLLDPYHARDFQNIFSTVDARVIESMEVYTGSLPVRFGDQLSGSVFMNTIDPSLEQRNEIGISAYNTSALLSGALASGRGGWLVSARRGNLDLIIKPSLGAPRYHDLFGTFNYELSPDAVLSVNTLFAKDEITVTLANTDEDLETASSDTRNFQLWAQLDNQWNDSLHSATLVSVNSYTNYRTGDIDDIEKYVSTVKDRREFHEGRLRQDWDWAYADRHILQWGFEFAFGSAEYDYFSDTEYFGLPLLYPGTPDSELRDLEASPDSNAYSLYLADKWQFAKRTFVEYGLRYDQQSYGPQTFGAQISPRLSFFHATQGGTEFRLNWGRNFMAQDLRELQIEDGVTEFFAPQRADQVVLGIRKPVGESYSLRLELYQKDYDRLRPRFENLYDPLALVPEVAPDRIELVPGIARARGFEVMLDRVTDGPLSWWIAYTVSEVWDRVDGVESPRSWDQQHAIRAGLNWSSERWDAGLAVNIHDGWPTTSLAIVEVDDGSGTPQYIAEPGPRNAEQFATFATLEARVNRRFRFGDHKVLNVFVEVSNALDRQNPCCVDFDLDYDEAGVPSVERQQDYWLPLVPAIGFILEF